MISRKRPGPRPSPISRRQLKTAVSGVADQRMADEEPTDHSQARAQPEPVTAEEAIAPSLSVWEPDTLAPERKERASAAAWLGVTWQPRDLAGAVRGARKPRRSLI